ncbi:MAG: hypothetical protein FJW51_06480 [Actinobacteria bacterium]|nr:hypothetical protein [Actinomycetota bacterium]
MNEDSPVSDSTQSNDPKAKFLEALEKKKSKGGATPGNSGGSGSKIGKGEQGANAPKMFRRKSGGG